MHIDEWLWVKEQALDCVGDFVEQHVHVHDHVSFLATGTVDVWMDGAYAGRFSARCAIPVKAGVKHMFQAVVDDCLILCIHNLRGAGEPEVMDLGPEPDIEIPC